MFRTDSCGLLPGGGVVSAYDDRGLLLAETLPGSSSLNSSYAYDANGRMTARNDTNGSTGYVYTARDELDYVVDPLTGSYTDFDWNDAGQVSTVTYAGAGLYRSYGYDGMGRVDTDVVSNGSTIVNSAAYAYDADSNVTSQYLVAAGNSAAGSNTYTYDRLGRLASYTDSAYATTSYTYDAAGNRVTGDGKTFTYDERNRLTSDGTTSTTWSKRGTMLSQTTGSTTTNIVFDALDRQTSYGSTNYTYDSLDRIVTRGSDAFTYDAFEIDPVKVGTERFARTPSAELLAQSVGGTGRYVAENRHGDVSWLASSSGITDTKVWKPYGQIAGTTGSTATQVGFQSDFTDSTSGNVWMGARWYSPTNDTFTSRDTVSGMLANPVTLNRYTYANNDPMQYFDPDGRFGWDTVTGALGWAANKAEAAYNWGTNTAAKAVSVASAGVSIVNRNVIQPAAKVLTAANAQLNSITKTAIRGVGNGIMAPIRACTSSQLCRQIAVAAIVVGVVAASGGTLLVPTLIGGAIGGAIGFARCNGDANCVVNYALSGAAAGALTGGSGAILGGFGNAFIGGTQASVLAQYLSTGKVDARQAVTDGAINAATFGLFKGAGAILAKRSMATTGGLLRQGVPSGFKGAIPDVAPKNLVEQLALKEARASGGRIIMTELADEPRLIATYGQGEWVKMQSVLRGIDNKTTVHWFKNLSSDIAQEVEFKIK